MLLTHRARTALAPRGARCPGRRGQAMFLAVLIMLLILLVGAGFVAIVVTNQTATIQAQDTVSANALADFGVRYAHRMMLFSPLGGDWRPPRPTDPATGVEIAMVDGAKQPSAVEFDLYYTEDEQQRQYYTEYVGGSLVRLGYTKYPDPLDPGGVLTFGPDVAPEGSVLLLRVTYDPAASKHIRIDAVGHVTGPREIYRPLTAYQPYGITDFGRYITNFTGKRSEFRLGLDPYMDRDLVGGPETILTVFSGGLKVNGDLMLTGDAVAGATTNEIILGADDTIEVAGKIMMDVVSAPASSNTTVTTPTTSGPLLSSVDGSFSTLGGRVLDDMGVSDGVFVRNARELAAPSLLRPIEPTGTRYLALTRGSGTVISAATDGTFTTPVFLNTGTLGFGRGIYVDNAGDIQFGHDVDLLEQDWLRQLGATSVQSTDSGWNPLQTCYSPRGVEVRLFPDELTAAGGDVANISGDAAAVRADTTGSLRYWPNHTAGEPGLRLLRGDARTFRDQQVTTWYTPDGLDSGLHEIYMDFPANGVIMAEGNIRIEGILPSSAVGGPRYDLTVVSGATIYIEGALECVDTLLARQAGGPREPAVGHTKIALLAADSVCLNPTQIVPQLTTGSTPALEDDVQNPDAGMHWELNGPGDGVYTAFMIGNQVPGSTLNLVVKQCGEDPGPSIVNLLVDGTPYAFGPGAAGPINVGPTDFAFVTPGFLPLGPNVSYALSPQYEWLATGAAGTPAAGLPWVLPALTPGPAVHGLTFMQNLPQSTEYWLRTFKIEEVAAGAIAGALDIQVCALIFAQRGSWFVIPGGYFEPLAGQVDVNGDGAITPDEDGDGYPDALRFRRYNYKITVVGAISEDHPASLDAVREWTDKWSYPDSASSSGWSELAFIYDPTLVQARAPTAAGTADSNLAVLPCLPVSEDLIFYGER